MPLRKPEDFEKEGSKVFRRAPANTASIQGRIDIARGKANDSMNSQNSTSTRLGAAYDTVFNLSLAVLSTKGWRCTASDGHHAQGLEAACAYAGVTVGVFDEMDAVRDLRNSQYNWSSAVGGGCEARGPLHGAAGPCSAEGIESLEFLRLLPAQANRANPGTIWKALAGISQVQKKRKNELVAVLRETMASYFPG